MAQVVVAPEVRGDWERGEGEVRLMLRSDVDLATAFAAMSAVSDRVSDRPDDPIEMWRPAALPFGVGLFVVMDPPQYDAVLDGLVAGLEAEGISGVLTSHGSGVDAPHPLAAQRRGVTTELITCRVSLVGQPAPPRSWRVDGQVIDTVVSALVRWCLDGDPARELHYSGAGFSITTDGDEAVRLLSLQLRNDPSEACSVACALASEAVREVDFSMWNGYVALMSAPRGPMGDRWREHVDAVVDGLSLVAGPARYAMVRRGSTWRRLASADVLARDWVAMPHLTRPQRLLTRALVLEDHRVPDAFGIQLLGPGHAASVPSSGDWTRTVVAGDRVLLKHRDPAAWYARPRPDEATLRAARVDLGPLLMDDDAVLGR